MAAVVQALVDKEAHQWKRPLSSCIMLHADSDILPCFILNVSLFWVREWDCKMPCSTRPVLKIIAGRPFFQNRYSVFVAGSGGGAHIHTAISLGLMCLSVWNQMKSRVLGWQGVLSCVFFIVFLPFVCSEMTKLWCLSLSLSLHSSASSLASAPLACPLFSYPFLFVSSWDFFFLLPPVELRCCWFPSLLPHQPFSSHPKPNFFLK